MITEKRKHRRIPFERPVSIKYFSGEKEAVYAFDFSLDGICFSSDQPGTIGEILTVTMNIGGRGKVNVVQAIGEVVYRYHNRNGYIMGMRFYQEN